MKLAIQFGAGAIGRGLLGKIIHDSGYELVFVDVFDKIVDQINEDGYVGLELMDHDNEAIKLDKVSALCSTKTKNCPSWHNNNISKSGKFRLNIKNPS